MEVLVQTQLPPWPTWVLFWPKDAAFPHTGGLNTTRLIFQMLKNTFYSQIQFEELVLVIA